MRAVVQRVSYAQVEIDGEIVSSIGNGLLIYLGVGQGDKVEQADRLWKKISRLRLFEDEEGKTNLSLTDVQGEVLIVSQFTLYASSKKGNRPSFAQAAIPEDAEPLYEHFVSRAREDVPCVETGCFGAHMQVTCENDGPFTLWLDTEELWPTGRQTSGGTGGSRRSAARDQDGVSVKVVGGRKSWRDKGWESNTGSVQQPGGGGRRPSPQALVCIVAVIAIVVVLLVVLFNCSGSSSDSDTSATITYDYDWTNLQQVGDRLYYYDSDGVLCSQVGVDVSDHQGDIDWEAVADDGIDFAIVRLGYRGYTEGGLYEDAYAEANLDGAEEAGLLVGAYFFSQAITEEEAIEEAEFVIEILDGRELDLPIAFDHEAVTSTTGRANDIDGEQLAACAKAFCETLEEAGYETVIYGSSKDLDRYEGESFGNRLVWLAEYDYDGPVTEVDFVLWQYTSSGEVDGIETEVDLNLLLTVTE